MMIISILLNLIAEFALFLADASAGTNCYLWAHQPKFPEKLRR